ncbi:MAG: VWA domain-containing protein [Proteobacteria bacterium]|nr:VWA domain-containing protein [Pseudomonadota bacterium]
MFINPLGLIALIAVPAVVGLHLFRRRHQTRVVSATFLWDGEDKKSRAGRRREPLLRSASFWLEVLAAICLGLAIAGIRGCGIGSSDHAVIVLDGSASMTAVEDAARDEARSILQGLPRSGRATVIVSGADPMLLAGPAALEAEALAALDAWEPGRANHELGPTMDLATELAQGGAITLVTDRFEPESWPTDVGLVALGEASDNLGITRSSRVPGAKGDVVFVEVTSFAGVRTPATLFVRSGKDVLFEEPVIASILGRDTWTWTLPEGTGPVTVELELDDGLDVDDRVELAPAARRVVDVDVTLEAELADHMGIAGDRLGELFRDVRVVPSGADLTIGPGDDWALSFEGDRKVTVLGPFIVDRGHAATEGVTLDGVIWTRGETVPAGRPLVSAGDRALLTQDGTVFRIDLDPYSSTLHRSPDWPILLSNLIELRRSTLPGLETANVSVGSEITWIAPEPGVWTLDGQELPVQDDLVLGGLDEPGLHVLARDGVEVATVGVQLGDPAESDLRGRSSGRRVAEVETGTVRAELSGLDTLFLLLALGLFCLDMWVLRKRESA